VRKGEYLNVGIGRRDSRDFAEHVKDFITLLERRLHLTLTKDVKWKGHAYLASGTGPRPLIASGLLLIGDAAGLAYPESGEGIRPAVESGRLAAETLIAAQGRCGVEHLRPYADALQRLHPPTRPSSAPVRAVSVALGRVLLRSRAFTRRVVLDKWFLRRTVAQSFAGVQSVRH
jgi:flavin-dependent dehydrogenase